MVSRKPGTYQNAFVRNTLIYHHVWVDKNWSPTLSERAQILTLCLYVFPMSNKTSSEQEPTSHAIVTGLIQVLFDRLVVKSYRGRESPPKDSAWQDNDPKYFFWLDIGSPGSDIKHKEFIIPIIDCIRDSRPNIDLLTTFHAYMAEYEFGQGLGLRSKRG